MAHSTLESSFERWRSRGDAAALSDVFDALAPGLLRLAIHLMGDVAVAEDLVQQTFVTAMERAASWDVARAVEPWLQGILANHARDWRKSAQRRDVREVDLDELLARDERTPLDLASQGEASGELARAVDALEEPYRAAALLRLRHGMEVADIAHVLGRSPGAVRVQLHRARELLKKSLPAGIAGALVLLCSPARGLDAVRIAVLGLWRELAPPTSVPASTPSGVAHLMWLAPLTLSALIGFSLSPREGTLEPARVLDATATASAGIEALDSASNASAADARTVEPPPPSTLLASETVRGIVRDANTGQPVAGAQLEFFPPTLMRAPEVKRRLWEYDVVDPLGELRRAWPQRLANKQSARANAGLEDIVVCIAPAPGTEPAATATSGDDGRFELANVGPHGFLTCLADGYVRREVPLAPDSLLSSQDLTVNVSTNRILRGRLVDSNGASLSRSIELSFYGHAPMKFFSPALGESEPPPNDRRIHFVTDGEGRFELAVDVHRGRFSSLDPAWDVMRHAQFDADGTNLRELSWIDLVDSGGDCRITVEPCCTLSLRNAGSPEPIETAFVSVCMAAAGTWVHNGWFHLQQGRLRLTPSQVSQFPHSDSSAFAAPAVCEVWSPGYAAAELTVESLLQPGTHVLELSPQPWAVVQGRLHRGDAALSEADIFLRRAAEDTPRRIGSWIPISATTTDATGGFTFSGPPGRYVLAISHASAVLERSLDLPHYGALDIDLDASATLVVHVRDESGAPADDIDVRVRDAGGLEVKQAASGGEARFENLVPGSFEIRVNAGLSLEQLRTIELLPGAELVTEITLPSLAPRFARLIVEDANGVAGWKWLASPWNGTNGEVEPSGRVPFDFRRERSFVLESPAGAQWWITMPTDAPDGAEVRLRMGGRGYRGEVRERGTGTLLAEAKAWFEPLDGVNGVLPSVLVDVDEVGRFEVRGLRECPYYVRFVHRSGDPSRMAGVAYFRLDAAPTDPPAELSLAWPRAAGESYAGFATIAFEGRFTSSGVLPAGTTAYVYSKIPEPGATLLLYHRARVKADRTISVRVTQAPQLKLTLHSGETGQTLFTQTWTPSGSDPETREFVLPP